METEKSDDKKVIESHGASWRFDLKGEKHLRFDSMAASWRRANFNRYWINYVIWWWRAVRNWNVFPLMRHAPACFYFGLSQQSVPGNVSMIDCEGLPSRVQSTSRNINIFINNYPATYRILLLRRSWHFNIARARLGDRRAPTANCRNASINIQLDSESHRNWSRLERRRDFFSSLLSLGPLELL